MRLYSGPLSLFARKVEIALYEKGVDFERVEVAFTQTEGYRPKHPDVVTANPKGQVPVLVDGDLTIFDSTVILEYLEDAYPEPPLYPAGPKEKARCRLVELDADEILFVDVRRLLYRTEPPLADAERQKARQDEGQRGEKGILGHYERLAEQLGGRDYFCGAFTAADIGMFTTVHYAVRMNGPRLNDFPPLAAWYRRVCQRPSVARVVAEIAEADGRLSWPLSA
ncbi:glutathione S-transferase family protein [Chelativorans xinjiangense]|uniref:glutathione S-transferase family protein n=1 Tax=Chelativorans xinjiangense TaxID=2681485 RepID=UPI00135CBC40|nr:glutathione S-transferase family protein [Chelativorans xinjiangense]